MIDLALPDQLPPPRPDDDAAVERGRRRWQQLAVSAPDTEIRSFLADSLREPPAREVLEGIFGGSPFLTDCLVGEPDMLRVFLERGPDAAATALRCEADGIETGERSRLMAGLRRLRRRWALHVALADLTMSWSLDGVTASLTELADLAVDKALRHLIDDAVKRGELASETGRDPVASSGIFVLGMGKHGAAELNYSSDIDLIVLFDEERLPYRGAEAPMALAARLTRSLVYLLEQKTRDGYVFRTDLRLRPHIPGHPLALATEAAELYYERHGQNWERAAFIKARVVAGDRRAGLSFLTTLQPYVWRKHLDFAAIRDIHSIKRQINAHRGFGTIRVLGHDLKVGRGGIREIEFFVQTQQLILGGRSPELREAQTVRALEVLARQGWIEGRAAEDLTRCYRLLRALEHRLQMVQDRQTQALPRLESELARFAAFAGLASAEALSEMILETLKTVERHYADLFEAEADLGVGGNLVFTGTSDDPDTLETLAGLGFKDPSGISGRIRAWHHGHIRATRSTRARELLTELTPSILDALQRQPDIDAAFRLFDEFVSGLPAGVQLFSLFRANPRLLALVADLMGAAPRLACHLAGNVDLFEAMLQPDFFGPLPERPTLEAELGGRLGDARDLQDMLDLCRHWAHGRQFQAGLHVLLGLATAQSAAATLTAVAEIVIGALLPRARAWLEAQHGRIADGAFVVVGLGKLGSAELTTGSDLDLVFVYDAPEDATSTGERPLAAPAWFARLGQRLVSAITARTPEGRLFEIDMRLRPSGNMGPVATSLDSFARYHEQTAEVWEQQALTRARVVAGDQALATEVEAVIARALTRERGLPELAAGVRAMRERIFREHGSNDPWNLKHARGALVEIEFIAQLLVLAHAHAHPGLLTQRTLLVLDRAGELGLIAAPMAAELAGALRLHHALQAVLRLSTTERFVPASAPRGLARALVRAAELALPDEPPLGDLQGLERRLVESQTAVRQIFDRLCPPIGTPTQGRTTMTIGEGDQAPPFDLPADSGGRIGSSALAGRPYVIYFYPKDDTSGCTKEAIAFTEHYPEFKKLGVEIVGISKDSVGSHDKFKAKYGLGFPLASDEAGALIEAFGSWVEKSMYGKKYMGIDRSTFLVGADGRVVKAWRGVKVPGHVESVLEAAKAAATA